MIEQSAKKLVEVACSKIRDDDIVHRGFLKPIEIALKTYKTEIFSQNQNNNLRTGSLPAGLKVSVKTSVSGEKRTLKDIQIIKENETFSELQMGNKDNLLTLMKKKKGIKLAICVCMYSETKPMLKSSLAGIAENIANLVAYQKMDPDDIGVFVMMDGIEKVDESILSYFQELERSSNINLGINIAPSLSVVELADRSQTMTPQQINELQMKNVNNYLFNVAQLQERNSLRFESILQDYNEKKDLLAVINKLNSNRLKKPHYDDLNRHLQTFFLEEAKSERKKDYGQTDQQIKSLKTEVILEEYINDVRRSRPMITKALQKASHYCTTYLQGKDDLAYLSCFRKKVDFSAEMIQEYRQSKMSQSRGQFGTEMSFFSLNQEAQMTPPSTIMNLFLCIKYKNSGKLSSHNWFFNGFCKQLRPQFAILLDVGLRPDEMALLKMYKYMDRYQNIGGVCGYMSLKMEKVDQSQEIKEEQVDWLTNIATKFVEYPANSAG